ncbi:Retrovirus-related Pol polyprotein from type-1 retrotransposable element R2 [Portunus trituberculatus]|uniref:Retrovirus-related Pol polyprotein from type-1 retrotransposable element R2 n=1 Tax=Portunus trituberculatus TaxID=210409 RepID=A0A5B7FWI0_PORTR|nr:Retrovirus-related Pol polyprotein from type-1 retrotransposable element R2 [Portunus trituberculatus]
MRPGETYKYLGLEVGPAMGHAEPERALAALVRDLGALQKAPLKPQQNLWAALQLPRDTPVAALHAKMGQGGLGIPSFQSKVPALKRGALERHSKSSDTRVARIAAALLQNPPGPSSKEQTKAHITITRDTLYASADDQGLSGTDRSPPTHKWVDDSTLLMRGSTYVNDLKTRLGVVNTEF